MRVIRKLLAFLGIIALFTGVLVALKGFSGFDPLALDLNKTSGVITERGKDVLSESVVKKLPTLNNKNSAQPKPKEIAVVIALVSDSHTDNTNLEKALAQAKQNGAQQIIALGDFTQVGTVQELNAAKKVLDASGLPYHAIPGDHDMWDNKNRAENGSTNFESVFGDSYKNFSIQNANFILINNANNDAGLSQTQWQWLSRVLEEANAQKKDCPAKPEPLTSCVMPILIFVHEPLYHPTSSHIMGKLDEKVEEQRKNLLKLLKKHNVNEIISGDLHFFGQFSEPTYDLPMTVVGAVANERNPQKPRYALLKLYTDGTFVIEDQEIQQ